MQHYVNRSKSRYLNCFELPRLRKGNCSSQIHAMRIWNSAVKMALRNRVVKSRAQRIRVKNLAQINVTAVLVLNAFFEECENNGRKGTKNDVG